MKEIEFLDDFCRFLDKRGYQFKREFRRRTYHNEGYVDVVIYHNKKFIAVEAKVSNFAQVYNQAGYNLIFFHFSYILYPRMPAQQTVDKLNYVGLIIPDKDGGFKIVKKSRRFHVRDYTITRRNWFQNRVGRILKNNEIPKDYDPLKIDQLKSTYDWVHRPGHEIKEGQRFIDEILSEEKDYEQ